jgi:hypothetical protein
VTGPSGGRSTGCRPTPARRFEFNGIKPDRLPDAPVGYDALDLLVLQRADLNRIDRDRQQAIADWVRTGGCLLVIPPDEPLPADGPLVGVLPCKVGATTEYLFPDDLRPHVQRGGRKSTGVRGFALAPKPGAEPLVLWPEGDGRGAATAYAADVGFGRVIVAPFDITDLQFSRVPIDPAKKNDKGKGKGAGKNKQNRKGNDARTDVAPGGVDPAVDAGPQGASAETDPGRPAGVGNGTIDDGGIINNAGNGVDNYDNSSNNNDNAPPPETYGGSLYRTLLGGTGLLDGAGRGRTVNASYGLDPVGWRQEQAVTALQDHLGSVPGAGRFGFSYVAWVVLGMMVLVGPVDWFVLKRLGRQPWTWVTTTGWIGAVTVAALYAGHVFKSGDLHYRTVAVVDQADNRVVARTTLAGLYSPKTTIYHFDAPPTQADAQGNPVPTNRPPAGWWDPASGTVYGGGGLKVDVPFHQTTEGNLPEPMTVNVWNLRFLRGENLTAGDPMVRASLRFVPASPGANRPAAEAATLGRVEGTITNLSDRTLADVRVRVGDGLPGRHRVGHPAGGRAAAGRPGRPPVRQHAHRQHDPQPAGLSPGSGRAKR